MNYKFTYDKMNINLDKSKNKEESTPKIRIKYLSRNTIMQMYEHWLIFIHFFRLNKNGYI